ncbi:MAG: YicC family protein [Deltaproteobacteria bacterium]|nr:YicC family protein [Deltaproteobacteria bacterium]
MIKSMTAFGRAEKEDEGRTYIVEIRTLNRRYLEVLVRLPRQWFPMEDRVKKLVGGKIARGRVDVSVKVKDRAETVSRIEVNVPLAQACLRALRDLNRTLELEERIGLKMLLAMEGVVTATEPEVDLDRSWKTLSSCIGEALEGVDAMRISEGKTVYDDFQKRLGLVDNGFSKIKALSPSILSEYHDRLHERITVLTEGKVELDPNRLAQEVAFLVDKGDITEEIVRAQSHLKQFRGMIESEGAAGRSLDFLLQELNREVNTIGSKVGDAELSQVVVSLKSELEKIREQVQNVE